MFAPKPLDHELVLLAWGKPGPDWLPWAAGADAAVFRLRDADQAFLRHRIDSVVIDLEAPLELPGHRMLAGQAVSRMHRHQPRPRERLLCAIPEVRLIPGIDRNRAS